MVVIVVVDVHVNDYVNVHDHVHVNVNDYVNDHERNELITLG